MTTVFVVSNEFVGVKFYKKKPNESTQSSAKLDDEGNKIPATLTERREKLQKRRDKKFIAKVMELISEENLSEGACASLLESIISPVW